ncbi:MAG: ABC transporter permease [Phycisphaerales bacterium]|nr:ABC transporter permease [Phycisphaerales bacterium]
MIQDKPNTPSAPRFRWSDVFETWGGLMALVIMAAVCSLLPATRDSFLNPENILNIVNQKAFLGIVAIGMTFVIISGGIDLSVGSMIAFVGGLAVVLMKKIIESSGTEWLGVLAACAIAPLAGMVLGWITGLIVSKGRVAPFIATLCGLAAYRSAVLVLMDGGGESVFGVSSFEAISSTNNGIPLLSWTDATGRDIALHLTWPIIVFISIAILGQVLLSHTRFGRYVVAVGSNETAARYSAINVDRVRLITYTIVGLCTGIAAVLLASRLSGIDSSNTGILLELDAIAAVVIGGTRLSGGRGRIWGTVIGVLILGMIDNVLILANVSSHWQGLVTAGVILLAVLLQRSRSEG